MGGLVRYGPVTIAPFLQAVSPDGVILVQLGDWHIQDYSDIPGWRAGTVYTPGTSVMLVRRLESAKQYARSYGLNFGKWLGCEESQFADSEVAPTPAGLATVPNGRDEQSSAHFTCVRSGQKYCRAGDDDRAVLSTTDGNNRLECVVPGERAYAARSGRHRYRGVGRDAGHDPNSCLNGTHARARLLGRQRNPRNAHWIAHCERRKRLIKMLSTAASP